MRCLFVVLLAILAPFRPALAADYDLPPLRGSQTNFIPAFPRYYTWEGFYAGGQLGYGNANVDFAGATQSMLALQLRGLAFEQQTAVSKTQILGATDTGSAGFGGFAGYNMQFDNTVLGVEFNYTHTNFNAIAPSFPIARLTPVLNNNHAYEYAFNASASMKTTDVALFQARAGYVADRFMPFLTLGLAVGRTDVAAEVSCVCKELEQNPTPPPTGLIVDADFSFDVSNSKNSAYIWGYTGGAGFDMMLTPNIFARFDYEYIQWSHIFDIPSHINMGHLGLGLRF